MAKNKPATSQKNATKLVHAANDPKNFHGFVNPPVIHASTVLFPSYEAILNRDAPYVYGRRGTPTSDALENLLNQLEGAQGTIIVPSGLCAIATALLSCLKSGDHALIADTVYGPTRAFCDNFLIRFGVEVEYYDPTIGKDIAALLKDNSRVIFMESPGSLTFEIQDVPAIVDAAKAHGHIRTLIDNTWGTPLYFPALQFGVDMSIMAATKYVVGHSDAMLGTISANAESWPDLRNQFDTLGLCAGPDDIYLALRGLRTMAIRLKQHHETGVKLARFLESRSEVARVIHPALESHPQHALWQRDFKGASGLFSFELKPVSETAIGDMLNGLEFFGMGFSWGGFESLAVPQFPHKIRTATKWNAPGHLIRIHAGLEDADELIADLEAGLDRLKSNS